jgi:acyl carrier protein
MTDQEMKKLVLDTLLSVAPEADVSNINPDRNLQEELDIDSIDFLNFVMSLHKKTGVDVPERDYPKVLTLNGCVSYLLAHSKAGATG